MNKIPDLIRPVLRSLIWLYRHSLSYFLGRHCRFMPTCSAYADEAIRIHGTVQGTGLAFRRLCRCHPWGGQGFDPVPPRVKNARISSSDIKSHG